MISSSVFSAMCAAASLSLVCACASAPPPKDRMAWAQAEVAKSEQSGAERIPAASAELQRAKGEIRLARSLSRKGENDKAESMLRRAAADADLSLALAREARVAENPTPTEPKGLLP